MTAETHERHRTYFRGQVQGVGFRYTTHRIAARYAVVGFVRNLPDGRVELVVEGMKTELDQMMADVQQAMTGYIYEFHTEQSPATGEFVDFRIRH